MKQNFDGKIWDEFKRGNNKALSQIYHQNIDFLFFYGKKFTTDEELVLDTIQDLFFYFIQKRNNLGKTENIRMYILKAFRRRLFEEIKKTNKLRKLNSDLQIEPQITFSKEEDIIARERQSKKDKELQRGMQKLNARQREVLYYKFTCGFDYDQICEIMSISYESARKMVSRSVNSLKKYLNEQGFVLMLLFRAKKI